MNNLYTKEEDFLILKLRGKGVTYKDLATIIKTHSQDSLRNRVYELSQEDKFNFEKEKVLVFDIETSLMIFTAFHTGEQYLSDTNILDDYFILSWAAKWLGEEEVFSDVLTSTEAKKKNDKRIMKSLWKLIDEADVIIGHNLDKFDIKKINTRFIYHRLGLPRDYKTIDTLKILRKNFALSSNKLDYACRFLGIPCKTEHSGYEMWLECLKGSKTALSELQGYNRNDVPITETLYSVIKEGKFNYPKRPKTGWKEER